MKSYPFTRKYIWLSFALVCISMPFVSAFDGRNGIQFLIIWPLSPLVLSFLIVYVYARKNCWYLKGDVIHKGSDSFDSINLSEVEWVLFGKPKTDMDERRYVLTQGRANRQFWNVIDNTICLKTVSGYYLMLSIHFHNGSREFLSAIREKIKDKEVEVTHLNERELRAFKFGDSNNIFRL